MKAAQESPAACQARLLELINAGWTTQVIAVACEFDLPDRLSSGPRTVPELAGEAGVDADALGRLLRALVTLEVCEVGEVGEEGEEGEEGIFSLGPLGRLLCRDHAHGLRHWALLNGGPLWTRWGALSEKVRTGNRVDAGGISAVRFRRLETDGQEAALFHGAMTELSRRLENSLLEALPVARDAMVVDVGGGSGQLLASILSRHPTAQGLLFDLPHALAHAPPVLGRLGVEQRCALQEGNFFDHVPPAGDLYLLKSVLHDWDDAQAVQILRRCRQAMKADAKLVVIERLLPERAGTTPEHRAVARSDLNMLVGLAGRERTLAKYRALLAQAGLDLKDAQTLAAGFSALPACLL